METSGTKVNGLHETFFIKTKIFSLYTDNRGQNLLRSHYISSILLESFNCFAGVFRKIFYCPPTIIGNFHSKTSYFVKRKMPLTYIGNLTVGFTRILSIFLDKKMESLISNRNIKRKSDYCQTSWYLLPNLRLLF